MALGPTSHHFNAYGYGLSAVKRSDDPDIYHASPSSAKVET